MAKVQIDESLFVDLIKYHVGGIQTPEISKRIEMAINAKLDAIRRRDLYTKSKTGDTSEDRETARKAYLDTVGIRSDFRW